MIDLDLELTDREKAIVAIAAAAGVVVGLWAGLWMLPAEALAVPTHESESGGTTTTSPAFYPVPSTFFGVTLLVPAAAIWFAYVKTRDDDEIDDVQEDDEIAEPTPAEPTPATDGGTALEDSTQYYPSMFRAVDSELDRYRERLHDLEINGETAIEQAHAEACREEVQNLEQMRNELLAKSIQMRAVESIDTDQIIDELEEDLT